MVVGDRELEKYIDSVYREPYNLLTNNCIHKSIRISKKARERGKQADLVWCASIVKMKFLWNVPTINPHMYALVDGEKVDVSLDPGHEARYCLNSEKRLICHINLSRIRRNLKRIFRNKEPERDTEPDGY
jgi:hypothetical protein